MYFEYWQSSNDAQWYWRAKALGNHEEICRSSEGYSTEQNCLYSIQLVKTHAASASVYKR